jgi:hypothetical protein
MVASVAIADGKGRDWRGQVRLPAPLAAWVRSRAESNYRSVNQEFVELVRRMKEAEERLCQGGAQ